LVLNLCDVDVLLSYTANPPSNKDITVENILKFGFFCTTGAWGTCKDINKPSKPTDTSVPSLPRGANVEFTAVTLPAGANGNTPVMYASALSPGYAGGVRQDMKAGQWFLDNTRVKDVGMMQYTDGDGQMYIVFFPPIAGQPVLRSMLSWGAATLPTVGSTVSQLVSTAVDAAQASTAATGGAPSSQPQATAYNAWNSSTMSVTLNDTTVAANMSPKAGFTELSPTKDSIVRIGSTGAMVFGGGSADIPVAMWVTAGTVPDSQVDVIVWSSPSGVGGNDPASTSRVVTAYVADNTAASVIAYVVAKWVNTHHLEAMLPSTAGALATGGQPTSKCSDASTKPLNNALCSSTGQGTCQYTPYAPTSQQGDACSLYNTMEYGKYCRAQAAGQGAAGDADILKACAGCQDSSGDCTGKCPAVCTALYPACATSTMYRAGADGDSSFPMQFSPLMFVNTFTSSDSGAVPPDLQVNSGTTPSEALQKIKTGLLNNLECWWPEAVEAAGDIKSVQVGERFAQGGGMQCNGLLLTSKLRKKYGDADITCPSTVDGMPANCGQLVAKAMSDAVAHGTDGVKMTQLQTYMMTQACGIEAGVAKPKGLPHERKWPLIIGLGVAGIAVVLLLAAIATRLAKHYKAKNKAKKARK